MVTSQLPSPEKDLRKSLRYRRGLSYAVYHLSLSNVAFLRSEEGSEAPPPRLIRERVAVARRARRQSKAINVYFLAMFKNSLKVNY